MNYHLAVRLASHKVGNRLKPDYFWKFEELDGLFDNP